MQKNTLLLLLFTVFSFGQTTKKVLFLGNSYTQVNNLPLLIKNVANSTNDEIIFDSNLPGGYTFQGHSTNTTSLNKIQAGDWDYVVLQEQSQLPSFPIAQVQSQVFPYAAQLNTTILQYNPCAETLFYMTWGRKNGDAANCPGWPAVCTYEGMDDLISERYMTMATDNDAVVSPVGAVWRNLRTNNPTIELYSSDESHPSIAGSYAAALTFYTTIFRKNPLNCTFNSTLSTTDAAIIKQAVKTVVFDNLATWFVTTYDPIASFSHLINNNSVSFTNASENSIAYNWDFGDGTFSMDENPTHTYTSTGNFTVTLTITNCGKTSTFTQNIVINTLNRTDFELDNITIYPNPVNSILKLKNSVTVERVDLYDFSGKMILGEYFTDNESIILDVSSLTNGIYFLKITTAHSILNKKIIKK